MEIRLSEMNGKSMTSEEVREILDSKIVTPSSEKLPILSNGTEIELNYDQIIANDKGNLLICTLIEEKKMTFIRFNISKEGVLNIENTLTTFGSGKILRLINFWDFLIIIFSDDFLGTTLSVYTELGTLTFSQVITNK